MCFNKKCKFLNIINILYKYDIILFRRNRKLDKKPIRYKKVFLVSFVILLMYISAVYTYGFLAKVGSGINLDDANVPEIIVKADSCISPYVENEIISIFKENDPYYKFIDAKSVDEIEIKNKETIFSDDKGQKYLCSGIIEMISDKKGFRPKNSDKNNIFYYQIYNDKSKITKYTIYRLPIFYSTQIIKGNYSVEINEFYLGKFSCKGVCKTVSEVREEEQTVVYKKAKQKETKIDNNINNIQTEQQNKLKKDKKFLYIFHKEKKKVNEQSSDIDIDINIDNDIKKKNDNIIEIKNDISNVKNTDKEISEKKAKKIFKFLRRKKKNLNKTEE